MIFKQFCCILLSFLYVSGENFRFDNYTLYKIYLKNEKQVRLLQDLHGDVRYDFWTDPVPSSEFVQVMTGPKDKADFENFLKANAFDREINIPDIQEVIDKQSVRNMSRLTESMTWDAYYGLNDIYSWLENLATTYPTTATIISAGTSYEGRDIKGIKISHGPGRKVIFLEGGIHSREWISPATVNYITSELLTSVDEEIKALAQEFDWYIFPVTNPDGYVWSHESFRMWRKNRRPFGANFGVDLNRNWNSNWLVAGSSVDPATDIYAGPGPFSEPETRALSEFIRSIGDQIELYLSFHSFSQLLLIPFGNSTAPYGNYHDALNIGRRAMGALSVKYGTRYTTGNIAETIYEATGGSVDWAKDHLNIPLVYCYELRDLGQYGFLLPPEQILPTCQETMDSLVDLVFQAKRFGYMNAASGNGPALLLLLALIQFLWLLC